MIVVGVIRDSGARCISCCCCSSSYISFRFSVGQFGHNDPAHFGEVAIAMVTLFQVSTLSSKRRRLLLFTGATSMATASRLGSAKLTVVECRTRKRCGALSFMDRVDPEQRAVSPNFFTFPRNSFSPSRAVSCGWAITMAMLAAHNNGISNKDERTTNSQIKKQYDHLSFP